MFITIGILLAIIVLACIGYFVYGLPIFSEAKYNLLRIELARAWDISEGFGKIIHCTDLSGRSIEEMSYFSITPGGILCKWHHVSMGQIPRWSKLSKEIDKKYAEMQENKSN